MVQGNRQWKGWIYCYDEYPDGTAGVKVDIYHPRFPRRVFGLTAKDIEPWIDDA
jgi:hypothetical protein